MEKELVLVGFPQSSLHKYFPEGAEPAVSEDRLTYLLPEASDLDLREYAKDFENWKQAQPLAESKQQRKTDDSLSLADHPVTITGVFKEVMAWNVMEHTPIETMHFLTSTQQKLAGIY